MAFLIFKQLFSLSVFGKLNCIKCLTAEAAFYKYQMEMEIMYLLLLREKSAKKE